MIWHNIIFNYITCSNASQLYRTELREEMKRGLKEKDTDARILINEKGVLKDRVQKLEGIDFSLLLFISNLLIHS